MIAPLEAASPPETPFLRLETGTHTVDIKSIDTDSAGRWIATASNDKTLRLWEAATGRLLQTYRAPIDEGNEGKLYAVAMAPDAAWIATGGWTGYDWDQANSIYVFERATGRLLHRIAGLENMIFGLCVSVDGNRLGVMLGDDQGLRVYAPNEGFREVFADRAYGAPSYGCDFAADGRLVTSSWDGNLRLYRPAGDHFQRVAVRRAEGGARPTRIAFHPDGSQIAVGFEDRPAVDLIASADLSRWLSADTTGISNGSLTSVAWSPDGTVLLAGGGYIDGTGKRALLSWESRGRGVREIWPVADNIIMDIAGLPGGRVAVGAYDPILLMLDAGGRTLWQAAPATADLRDNDWGFRVSVDGRRLAFGLGLGGQMPVWLDLGERRLHAGVPDGMGGDPVRAIQQALNSRGYAVGAIDGIVGPATRAAVERFRLDQGLAENDLAGLVRALGVSWLASPTTSVGGLDIQGWKNTTMPTLNGSPLALDPYEVSRSLAIAPDGQSFLLGTEWYLRLFDRAGLQRWQRAAPGAAWGVNISPDGRLAVAAFGDGTLRWYRFLDGVELLALFPHRNGKDWVLWTPSGYYDASPGGDRLIGWHLNNGKDQAADFMPASQVRERFYRPDVVAIILDTLDESAALARAGLRQTGTVDATLPPVVELLEPVDGASFRKAQVRLRYRATSRRGEPITGLKVLVDGRPLPETRGLGRADVEGGQILKVTLPTRDLELSLIAENRHGASAPATVRLTWGGGQTDTPFVIKPKLYALAVGVSTYHDPTLRLAYPAKDARDIVKALQTQSGQLYREVVVRTLPDATAEEILDGLDWLRAEVTSQDVAMLFLAGHGVNDADGDYYFLPSDVDLKRLRRTAVAYYEIKKTLSALAGKTLAFIDTCHAGNIMGARRGVADITAVINDLTAAENGVVVFASSTGRQYALEDATWGNGAFSKALVEGLTGRADYTGDGRITINQLDLYLSERVKELTDNRQTPSTTKPETIVDYPIAVVMAPASSD